MRAAHSTHPGRWRNIDVDEGSGGDAGIRTLDTLVGYAHLANECLQPLGHVSIATRIDNPGLAIKVKSQPPPSFVTDTVTDAARRPARQGMAGEQADLGCRRRSCYGRVREIANRLDEVPGTSQHFH